MRDAEDAGQDIDAALQQAQAVRAQQKKSHAFALAILETEAPLEQALAQSSEVPGLLLSQLQRLLTPSWHRPGRRRGQVRANPSLPFISPLRPWPYAGGGSWRSPYG